MSLPPSREVTATNAKTKTLDPRSLFLSFLYVFSNSLTEERRRHEMTPLHIQKTKTNDARIALVDKAP